MFQTTNQSSSFLEFLLKSKAFIDRQDTIVCFTFDDHIRQVKAGNQSCWPRQLQLGGATRWWGWKMAMDKGRSEHAKSLSFYITARIYGGSSTLKDKQYFKVLIHGHINPYKQFKTAHL